MLNAIERTAAVWALGSFTAGPTGVLHGRRALLYELRRGVVVFSGEAAEPAGLSE